MIADMHPRPLLAALLLAPVLAGAQPAEFRDCAACPPMVVLPPGEFTLGSPADEPGRSSDEGPAQRVRIAHRLAVAKFEITFDDWQACLQAGGCAKYQPRDAAFGRGQRPVINVGMLDVEDYLAWLRRTTGKPYRLPSEAEWEYAARGGTTTPWPWGSEIGRNRAACDGCGSEWDRDRTAPVGSFAPNAFGLHDMVGNVAEWTADCWNPSHAGAPADGSARTSGDCTQHVVRGGGYLYTVPRSRVAFRSAVLAPFRLDQLGFRVVRTLD